MFLKRTKVDDIGLEDLYIGSTINLFSRQLTFVDYGDDFTRNRLTMKKEKYIIIYIRCSEMLYKLFGLRQGMDCIKQLMFVCGLV